MRYGTAQRDREAEARECQKGVQADLQKNGIMLKGQKLYHMVEGMNMMDGEITKRLEASSDTQHLELWHIHRDHINETYKMEARSVVGRYLSTRFSCLGQLHFLQVHQQLCTRG